MFEGAHEPELTQVFTICTMYLGIPDVVSLLCEMLMSLLAQFPVHKNQLVFNKKKVHRFLKILIRGIRIYMGMCDWKEKEEEEDGDLYHETKAFCEWISWHVLNIPFLLSGSYDLHKMKTKICVMNLQEGRKMYS